MKNIILIITILSFQSIFSQNEPFYKSYDWESNPKMNFHPALDEDIIGYKDKRVIEFIYDENRLVEYSLVHKIYWLNSDDKIEDYNKIYLPYSNRSELVANKARVITKNGEIKELDDSKIFTAKDEETKKSYQYYAFEGLEKESYIEYYYVLKRHPIYDGKRITFQTSFDKYNVDFELLSPNNLWFKFKSYNQLSKVEYDSTVTEKYHWILHADSLPKLERESQAPYSALLGYVIYKLYYNSTTNSYDISSYSKISENMNNFYYSDLNKGVIKKINKISKELGLKDENDAYKKIRLIEDYIKKNYYTVDISNADLKNLSIILDKKITSETGVVRLYIAFLRILNIKHEIVLTCDRTDNKFDNEFESGNFLVEYLIYFPKIKAYISPNNISSRLGYPSPLYTSNYGLFIKQVSMGEFKTAVGKIKFIKPVAYDKSYDNIKLNVNFDAEDLTSTKIKLDRSLGGYYAMNFQPIMHLLKEDSKKDMIESQIKFINEDIDILDKKVYNDNAEDFGIKPFRIVANIKSDAFIEKAGNKYLFKVGELIGPQQEMYQEKERLLPLENDFKRSYHREIVVNIPEGYTINNLDDININNFYKKDDETILEFKSYYKIEGNVLTIISDEYYKIIVIPVAIYEDYRKVINSAADFNKITLVIEKK